MIRASLRWLARLVGKIIRLSGPLICWLVRLFGGAHKWRRLRKKEQYDLVIGPNDGDYIPHQQRRVCDRCGTFRSVRERKAKAA